MANMSNYLANQLRDVCFRTQASITKPSTIALALTHTIPDATYGGAASIEVSNAGSYARQVLPPSDANWSTTGISGQTFNNAAFTFPVATSNWGWVSGIMILDSASYGSGNALAYGTLINPTSVASNSQYIIPVSGISIQWS